MLTGLIVFIMPGTATQLAVTSLIGLICIVFVSRFKPYLDDRDDMLQLLCQLQIFLLAFAGLLLKVTAGECLPPTCRPPYLPTDRPAHPLARPPTCRTR